jgi:hypothetical protein
MFTKLALKEEQHVFDPVKPSDFLFPISNHNAGPIVSANDL